MEVRKKSITGIGTRAMLMIAVDLGLVRSVFPGAGMGLAIS
jgi:hypothetical protein